MPLDFERPLRHVDPPHEALMASLQETEWLTRCGEPDRLKSVWPIEILTSWGEAVRSAGSTNWQSFRQKRRDELIAHVSQHSPEGFGEWDVVEAAVRSWIEENVTSILTDELPPQVSLDDIRPEVESDVLGFMLTSIYAGCRPPPFYREVIQIYRTGHFPCGWHGEYPRGCLRVL